MAVIYGAISAILLFWHAAWRVLFGDNAVLGTNWSWVLGIVFLVLTVRGVLFPVYVKQIKSQRAMQALQPRIKALQEKHKGDRETLQKELVELYRTERANPLMGFLPMLVQIPVFLGLFHVLRHLKPTMPEHMKTLYGWSVTQFDSASSATLFGAPIAASFRSTGQELSLLGTDGITVRLVAAILIVAMIATTYLSSRQMILRTGWSEDPQQKMVQRLMLYGIPLSLLVSGLIFPIGVIIYWVTTNLFSLGQQTWVLRKYPPPPASAAARTATGRPDHGAGTAGGRPDRGAKVTAGAAKAAKAADAPVPAKSLAPRPGARPTTPRKRAKR
ncbi:membrane protein insertase YidC [Micromonospora radicis]|uniref:Membrane protein insertase YidC n=2 Tax=Micromonospora radicis TaxID=1894971 RepID=A0A418N1W9_9ACTN|nr:membrane protein insertase YidC [Micromonospora radicis]RIV41606.1 membrane protein insertase YidC [Micromonospora radicis]